MPGFHSGKHGERFVKAHIYTQLPIKSEAAIHTAGTFHDGESISSTLNAPHTECSSRKPGGRFQGWRFGMACSALITGLVLVVNIVLASLSIAKRDKGTAVVTIMEGSCSAVGRWSTGLHLAINVLSSALLGASNYCMQCLCAPTRRDLDAAHARGDWLDIGVLSIRNLTRISGRRAALSILLMLSSLPIHLLYNSTAFKTDAANAYDVLMIQPSILDSAAITTSMFGSATNCFDGFGGDTYVDTPSVPEVVKFFRESYTNSTLVSNLSISDCQAAYSKEKVTQYSDALIVSLKKGSSCAANESLLASFTVSPFARLPDSVWVADVNSTVRILQGGGWQPEYCLVRNLDSGCSLEASLIMLLVVVVCNALKTAIICWTLFDQRDTTLITVGDAIASYLDAPDPHTAESCLIDRKHVEQRTAVPGTLLPTRSRRYHIRASRTSAKGGGRWFKFVTAKYWCTTLIYWILALTAASVGLKIAGGLGAINSRGTIAVMNAPDQNMDLLAAVLLANTPQIFVSLIYVGYNKLWTTMLLAFEWNRYYLRPKPLRVTTPRGQQRSTYWLQLPYTYSMPLIVATTTLHWLMSDSIFFSALKVYGHDGLTSIYPQVGYSGLPILLVVILLLVMMLVTLISGHRKFKGPMPVVSSCSRAIAAACHPPGGDGDAAYKPVSWGEVEGESEDLRHCCFTSHRVKPLTAGLTYA